MSRTSISLKLVIAAGTLAALSACATPFNANVSRFQQALPAPAGQSFVVVAGDPELQGGIEFGQYANLVANELSQEGYVPASSRSSADLVVSVSYGVDKGVEKVVSDYDPIAPAGFYGGYGRGFGRGGYYGRGYGRRYVYGFYDPFLYGGAGFGGQSISSYTLYTAGLNVKIDRANDGKRLFEGKAEARSRSNRLTYLVPNLVEAMFTDFPGNSGETLRISVAPEPKGTRR